MSKEITSPFQIKSAREIVIEALDALEKQSIDSGEPYGTTACPICGYDQPHGHTKEEQKAYRDDQLRADGWISTAKQKPKQAGAYLCYGHSFKPGKHDHDMFENKLREDKFLAMSRHETFYPEVLFYEYDGSIASHFRLMILPIVSTRSGGYRRELIVQPTFWREIPKSPDQL